MHAVELISRPGCHLCEDAKAVVDRVCADLGAEWAEVDLADRPELLDEYWEKVPVVLVDGRLLSFWHVHEQPLRKAILAP